MTLRRGDRNAVRLACAIVFILPLAALLSTQARADGPTDDYAAKNGAAVCKTLDAFPTFAGIEGVADAIHFNDGFSYRDAGAIEATAIVTVCPRHMPLLLAFIDAYGPAPTMGAIGGTYRASEHVGGVLR